MELRIEGTFEPIETCIDCLMGKCSFNFDKAQVTLDDIEHKTYEEIQTELGETLIDILKKTYWNPSNEVRDLPESEHRQTS